MYICSVLASACLARYGVKYQLCAHESIELADREALHRLVMGRLCHYRFNEFVFEFCALSLYALVSAAWGEERAFLSFIILFVMLMLMFALRRQWSATHLAIDAKSKNLMLIGDFLMVLALFAATPLAL